jgi:hypothetical protein
VAVVNGGTYGSEPHLPFGGLRQSGNGWREAGTQALDVYSSTSITIRTRCSHGVRASSHDSRPTAPHALSSRPCPRAPGIQADPRKNVRVHGHPTLADRAGLEARVDSVIVSTDSRRPRRSRVLRRRVPFRRPAEFAGDRRRISNGSSYLDELKREGAAGLLFATSTDQPVSHHRRSVAPGNALRRRAAWIHCVPSKMGSIPPRCGSCRVTAWCRCCAPDPAAPPWHSMPTRRFRRFTQNASESPDARGPEKRTIAATCWSRSSRKATGVRYNDPRLDDCRAPPRRWKYGHVAHTSREAGGLSAADHPQPPTQFPRSIASGSFELGIGSWELMNG